MQINQLLSENINHLCVLQGREIAEGKKVNVVCGIDGLRDAEDAVCDWDAAAEVRGVFYVVDAIPLNQPDENGK